MMTTGLIVALGCIMLVLILAITRLQRDLEGITGICLYMALYLKDKDPEGFGSTEFNIEDYLEGDEYDA